jgi:hypothetical protein
MSGLIAYFLEKYWAEPLIVSFNFEEAELMCK